MHESDRECGVCGRKGSCDSRHPIWILRDQSQFCDCCMAKAIGRLTAYIKAKRKKGHETVALDLELILNDE